MAVRLRSSLIAEAGLAAFTRGQSRPPTSDEQVWLDTLAAMLAEATKVKVKPKFDETKLAVTPRELFEAVRRGCTGKILCEPIDGRWFGRLGGILKSLPSFDTSDVPLLCDWIDAGGLSSWPQGLPTFGHLVTHLAKWTAFAREWHARGRHRIGTRSLIGVAIEGDAATDMSAFSVPKLE